MKRKILKYSSTFYLIFLLSINTGLAQIKEFVVQTAYIEKFTNYIEWPKTKSGNQEIFNIAILGNSELCEVTKKAFSQRMVKGKQIKTTCIQNLETLENVDLLYLASNKLKDLETALDLCKKNPFLLITNSKGFAKRGAHINFYLTAEQTLHFEINKLSLDEDGFKTDFLLLDFAKVVD